MKTYKLACPCGFSVGSHSKGEVVGFGVMHVAKVHKKKVSAPQMGKMVKTRSR